MVIETSGVKINSNDEELSSLSVMPTAAERQEKYGYQFPQFRDEFSYSYGRWEKPKEEVVYGPLRFVVRPLVRTN